MDYRPWFEQIQTKLTTIETKLDDHLDRLAHAEESISWLKGHVRVVTTIILAISGTIAVTYFNLRS